jgi:hypothetical protein
MYHPKTCNVDSEKTARHKPCNGVFAIREPTCISPTRRTKIDKLERMRSKARKPQIPIGNHDQKTGRQVSRARYRPI